MKINFSDMNDTLNQLNFGFLSSIRDKLDKSADETEGTDIGSNTARFVKRKVADIANKGTGDNGIDNKIKSLFNINEYTDPKEFKIKIIKAITSLRNDLKSNEDESVEGIVPLLIKFVAGVNPKIASKYNDDFTESKGKTRDKVNKSKDEIHSKAVKYYKSLIKKFESTSDYVFMPEHRRQEIIEKKIKPAVAQYKKELEKDPNAKPKDISLKRG